LVQHSLLGQVHNTASDDKLRFGRNVVLFEKQPWIADECVSEFRFTCRFQKNFADNLGFLFSKCQAKTAKLRLVFNFDARFVHGTGTVGEVK